MEKLYYYRFNDQNLGPLTAQEILNRGIDVNSTYVWTQGMTDWQLAKDVTDFNGGIPQPPSSQTNYNESQTHQNLGYPPSQQAPSTSPNQYANNTQQKPINIGNQPKPNNNMAIAVVCALLCCMPLGVVGIVYAGKVNKLYNEGNVTEAQEYADKAKKISTIGIIVGFVVNIIVIILNMQM